MWNQARSYWQILVGLPRLGIYALDGSDVIRPQPVSRLVTLLYVIAWAALVPRFMIALLMGGARLAGYPAVMTALYYPFAWADFIRTGADLVFILALVVWWLCSPKPDKKICGDVAKTALLALTVTTVLTDLVPLGLRYNPLTLLGDLLKSIQGGPIPPPAPYTPNTYDPRAFYVFNTITGLAWVSSYLLILLWAVWTIIRAFAAWSRRALLGPQIAPTLDPIEQQTRRATRWWLGVGLVLLVLHPLAFQFDWLSGQSTPDWWTLITFHASPA